MYIHELTNENNEMAKNKPKIKNEVLHPRYRVKHYDDRIQVDLGSGSTFGFYRSLPKYILSLYENNRFEMAYDVDDYTHINSEEEMFQQECICNVPMDFRTLVQIQKAMKHHYDQFLFPSKLELCNQKTNYIIDVSHSNV